MSQERLIKELSKIGYEKIQKKTRNLVLVYVPKSERDITMADIAKKLKGIVDKSPKVMRQVSSAGAITFEDAPFNGLMVGVKPDQSKSLTTDEQETLAGIFIATKLSKPTTDYSLNDLQTHGDPNVQSQFKIKDLYEKAGKGWIQSSITIADKVSTLYSGKYKIQQRSRSPFEKAISEAAKKFVKEAGYTMGLDKWNPADIWMTKPGSDNTTVFSNMKSILELNEYVLEQYKAKKIIGVSLKQVGQTAKVEVFNDGIKEPNSYTGYDLGKTGFVNALNGTIYFDSGSMVIRNFGRPESVSGEINGKLAQGGKVGSGPLFNIIKSILPAFSTKTHQQISAEYTSNSKRLYKELYDKFQTLDPIEASQIKLEDFVTQIEAKSNKMNFIISKYQVADIMTAVTKMTKKQKNQFVDKTLSYASSSTEISSVFIKVS